MVEEPLPLTSLYISITSISLQALILILSAGCISSADEADECSFRG